MSTQDGYEVDSDFDAADEFHTYDATDGHGGGRGVLIVLGIFLLIGAFFGVLYLAYQQGIREGARNAPPVIEAEPGPVKVAPDEPGGMVIPDTDKLVYDRIDGQETGEAGVEQLLPDAEEPIAMNPVQPVDEDKVSRPANAIEVLPPPLEIPPDPEAVAEVTESVPVPAPRANRPTSIVPAAPAAPVVVPASPAAAPAPQPVTAGGYVVQIAAFRDVPRAEAEFAKLQQAHPDILARMRSDIQRADLGDRGIYYRLRVGPLTTKDEADRLCTRLKGRGQDCLVREK